MEIITEFGQIWMLSGRLPEWNLKLPEKLGGTVPPLPPVPYAYGLDIAAQSQSKPVLISYHLFKLGKLRQPTCEKKGGNEVISKKILRIARFCIRSVLVYRHFKTKKTLSTSDSCSEWIHEDTCISI